MALRRRPEGDEFADTPHPPHPAFSRGDRAGYCGPHLCCAKWGAFPLSNMPAKRSGNGVGRGGAARNYSWPPFAPGHTLSRRHGLHSHFLMVEGKDEIAETAALLRALLPTYATAFEPMLQIAAARLWRLRAAYEFVDRTSEEERTKSFSESMNALENLVNRSLAALGLTPVSASELGVNLAKLAAASAEAEVPFQWGNLDATERRTLERLIAKGRRSSDGD